MPDFSPVPLKPAAPLAETATAAAWAWRTLIASDRPVAAFRVEAAALASDALAHPGLERLIAACLARDCPPGQIERVAEASGALASELAFVVRWCAATLEANRPALGVEYVVGALNARLPRTLARLSSEAIASFDMIEPAASIARMAESRRPSDFLRIVAATGLCDIETGLDARSRAPRIERVVHPTWATLLTLLARPQNDPLAPAPAIASIRFERLAGQTRTRIRPEFDWG